VVGASSVVAPFEVKHVVPVSVLEEILHEYHIAVVGAEDLGLSLDFESPCDQGSFKSRGGGRVGLHCVLQCHGVGVNSASQCGGVGVNSA